MSDNEDTLASLGQTEELRIQNSVADIAIPDLNHLFKELSEGIISRTEDSWRVFPYEVGWPNISNSSDVLEHETRLAIKALSSSGDAKGLAVVNGNSICCIGVVIFHLNIVDSINAHITVGQYQSLGISIMQPTPAMPLSV